MSGDDRDYTKQPQPWSQMWPGSDGWTDEWGVRHDGNAPDMGDAGPHPAGAKIAKQKAAEEAAYRRRLAEVAKMMETGRESVRQGGPGTDWPGWQKTLDRLHLQAQDERAARTPRSPSVTAPGDRTDVLPSVSPHPAPSPVSDDVGRRLLARWRRHR